MLKSNILLLITAAIWGSAFVAQRVGMSVELVSHLTSTGNNRPNGTRGWYAYARVGSDKSVLNAFRTLKNITT